MICRYDLKGLSVRGVCPECGTAVRGTILYTVDPLADEFQPMTRPRLTAACLVAWAAAGFIAILASWVIALVSIANERFGLAFSPAPLFPVVILAAAASGISMIGLIRPSIATNTGKMLLATAAMAVYGPLVWVLWQIHALDAIGRPVYFHQPVGEQRELLRLLMGACMLVVFVAVRPNARDLVRRSLVLRTGRVDRQTLIGLAIAAAIAMLGDTLRLASLYLATDAGTLIEGVGAILVAIGSLFLLIGAGGALVDAARISRVILAPSPSLKQILGKAPA
ncbi:MAG: hypothetical protein IBJ11_10575 [Phycisphaerales bacterium]|nr:hypothetical protein [Phycisphaerales bacterium]